MARERVSDYSELPTVRFGDEEGDVGIGVEFQGYYKGFKTAVTKYGEKKVHTFQSPSGDCQIWGSVLLDRKLAQVAVGNMTFITYDGLAKKERGSGKNPAKLFTVEQDKTDTIFVDVPKVSFRDDDLDNASDDGVGYEDEVLPKAAKPLNERLITARPLATAPSAERQAKVMAQIAAARNKG